MTEIEKAQEDKEDLEVALMREIGSQIRQFEARTGLTISDFRVDLAYTPYSTQVTNVSVSIKEFQ